jgi:WD40 repeat protein
MTCDHKFKTGSLKHKLMVQSGQLDLYAVAGGTSEIRLYKIEQHLKQTTPNLNKVITLTSHRNEVIDIAFAGNLCVTIGQDG